MSSNIFDSEKYQEAAQKAYDFIVRQLNVNNYTLFPRLLENYEDSYTSRIFATVDMPADARVNFPKYIYCDQFYDHEFQGVCTGGHKNTGAARKNLGVEITVFTDAKYRSCICFLHEDGTWRSEEYFRETDYYGIGDSGNTTIVKYETYWYKHDKIINESGSNGLKGFDLKYYSWVDDTGTAIDPDHFPAKVVWVDAEYQARIDAYDEAMEKGEPWEGEIPERAHFVRATGYTLRPQLVDDTVIDDAIPKYADYDTIQYVYADVEYKTEAQSIIYDGVVTASDLPDDAPELPVAPTPFIRDAIVQPGATKGMLIITWITNFDDACELSFDGHTYRVQAESVADGYYTFHATVTAAPGQSYQYTITGNGEELAKEFSYIDSNRYLLVGDPQITTADKAEVWYQVQQVLDPLPTLIISMGDQVDSIVDELLRTEQYHQFTAQQSVPIATVRGNHDRNVHFLGHYGLPNATAGNWYFVHNGVLFIEIDSNVTDVVFHRQFITQALQTEHTWAILLMHHSLYSTSTRAMNNSTTTLRNSLTSFIVDETDIDLVLAGHEHFLSHTTYPGKLFFTCPTCTGSKYYTADNKDVEWSQVTIDTKIPKYTVMDVSETALVLTTYDLSGNMVDLCSVTKQEE